MVETYTCNSKEELLARERYFIENNDCINKYIPTRTGKEYREANREKYRQYFKDYAEEHKEEKSEYFKKYYEENKKNIMKQQAKSYECILNESICQQKNIKKNRMIFKKGGVKVQC